MRFVYAIVGLVVLLGLYVGGYYATVSRLVDVGTREFTKSVPVEITKDVGGKVVVTIEHVLVTERVPYNIDRAAYRYEESLGESTMATFFGPMHWLDRKLRREYWEELRFRPIPPILGVPPPLPPPVPDDSRP